MRRRSGFTLIEMMVSVALILFIMVILTEAFGKGLESFRTLKALGDMETRMRATSALLRRDLAMDHFEGGRKLSDPMATWNLTGPPREGFFFVGHTPTDVTVLNVQQNEGSDADGLPSRRRTNHFLHFAVKAKGNDRGEFFTATVPNPSDLSKPTLIGNGPNLARSTFFDHPADARFQDTINTYSGQWAEVAYFLVPTGTAANGATLHTLYRAQYVMVADNSRVNWRPPGPPSVGQPPFLLNQGRPDYDEMCCIRLDGPSPAQYQLYFSTPSDVARDDRLRSFNDPRANRDSVTRHRLDAKPLLMDVVSFDVQIDRGGTWADLTNTPSGQLVGGHLDSRARGPQPVEAIKICLRVYDLKTKLSRQMTIIQDL